MSKRLFVGNLSWNTQEDDLIAAFEQNGRTVTSARIMTDRDTGRPRGFAFVEMGSEAEAQAAIQELDGTELDGRPIRVNEAEERQPRAGGGGGGGRSHGGGGGGGGRGGRGGGGGGRGGDRDRDRDRGDRGGDRGDRW
jgi:RNA recognition motif-containing protein